MNKKTSLCRSSDKIITEDTLDLPRFDELFEIGETLRCIVTNARHDFSVKSKKKAHGAARKINKRVHEAIFDEAKLRLLQEELRNTGATTNMAVQLYLYKPLVFEQDHKKHNAKRLSTVLSSDRQIPIIQKENNGYRWIKPCAASPRKNNLRLLLGEELE